MTQCPKLGFYGLKKGSRYLFYYLFMGAEGCGASRRAWPLCEAPRPAVSHLPGREGTRLPVPAPDTTSDFWRNRMSSHPVVNGSHSCGPLIFWSFDIFLVASIPFLVFPSMSQKTKMSKQLRAEISISCQSAVFPALSKRAPRGMPRAGKMTNYIMFSP